MLVASAAVSNIHHCRSIHLQFLLGRCVHAFSFRSFFRLSMAKPNPKRAKMDNLSSGSSSNNPENREGGPKRAKIIDTDTQSFEVIRKMRGFIDHTHFICRFLQIPKLIIFAPRRFGKSSHLDMVKKFLEIDVDKKTGKFSLNGLAETRKNYQIFNGTYIMHYKETVEDHLGKHPVIHLDFKKEFVQSYEEAKNCYRKAVHFAYLEHSYLQFSENLKASSQSICRKWCDDEQYKMQDLRTGLEFLTRYLYKHFDGARVYILVDECDAIYASALFGVRGSNERDRLYVLQRIRNILPEMLGPVTKGGDSILAGALLTGVSYMTDFWISHLMNNFERVRFLENSTFFRTEQLCGATNNEIVCLIRKLVKNKQLAKFEGKKEFLNDTGELDADKIIAQVHSHYNGYFDKEGKRIFCLWSVLQYLEEGDAKNYWNETDGIHNLFKILKCGNVASEIMKLMRGDMIQVKLGTSIVGLKGFVHLHDLIFEENENRAFLDDVFNILMDQGYLSYPEGGIQDWKFKLPNAEIRAALRTMIRNIVSRFWKISTTLCTSLIEGISFSLMKNEKELQNKMLAIYENLSEILRQREEKDHTLVNEALMLCVMYKTLDDANSFELANDSHIKAAEGKSVTLYRPDFLMLHKDDKKMSILWELKFKKEGVKDEYTTSLYALQEARGKVQTKNAKTKEYTESLKKLGREALFIGLSMDTNTKVSLSYSSSMEEKIFSISEEEHELYPELYETHKPIILLRKEESVD